jgi:hypothetical protein
MVRALNELLGQDGLYVRFYWPRPQIAVDVFETLPSDRYDAPRGSREAFETSHFNAARIAGKLKSRGRIRTQLTSWGN